MSYEVVLEREAYCQATFGGRVGVGVGYIGCVDVGLEEGTEHEIGGERILGAEFGHPDGAAGGYLADVLVYLADVGHIAVVGEVELEDDVALHLYGHAADLELEADVLEAVAGAEGDAVARGLGELVVGEGESEGAVFLEREVELEAVDHVDRDPDKGVELLGDLNAAG